MKKHQFFCFALILITSFVFSLVSETLLGEVVGYTAIAVTLAVFSIKTA